MLSSISISSQSFLAVNIINILKKCKRESELSETKKILLLKKLYIAVKSFFSVKLEKDNSTLDLSSADIII